MCRVCEITYKNKYFCTDCLFDRTNKVTRIILKDMFQEFKEIFAKE